MNINYNVPIEVTEKQYNVLIKEMAGVIAHRQEDGKFYITCWLMSYAKHVKRIIERN